MHHPLVLMFSPWRRTWLTPNVKRRERLSLIHKQKWTRHIFQIQLVFKGLVLTSREPLKLSIRWSKALRLKTRRVTRVSQVIEPPKRNNPMSGFFWNVRGLNKSLKHSIIRNWVNQSSMQFGCLLETRVKEGRSSQLLSSIFNGWSSLTNYESHRLGRIWVVWRENARLTPVFKSSQMITCSVLLEGKEEEFFCSFIYASNFVEERRIVGRISDLITSRLCFVTNLGFFAVILMKFLKVESTQTMIVPLSLLQG